MHGCGGPHRRWRRREVLGLGVRRRCAADGGDGRKRGRARRGFTLLVLRLGRKVYVEAKTLALEFSRLALRPEEVIEVAAWTARRGEGSDGLLCLCLDGGRGRSQRQHAAGKGEEVVDGTGLCGAGSAGG